MSLKMSPDVLMGIKNMSLDAYTSGLFDSTNKCYFLHHFCGSDDCPEAVEIIANKKFLLDYQDKFGYTALHISVRQNKPNYVKILINAGAKVNTQNVDKRTPLMTAARLGNPDIVKMLLEAGADPKLKDIDGNTAFQLTAFNDDPSICAALLIDTVSWHSSNLKNDWTLKIMEMD